MTAFQIILLVVMAIAFVIALGLSRVRRIAFRTVLIVAVLWISGMGAVAFPDLTTRIARSLGIGRGADLVLYCSVVFMLAGFFFVYLRLVRLSRYVTELVRHIAILEAREIE